MSNTGRKRYCFAQMCSNFAGTSDPNVAFFRTRDQELQIKWEQAVNGTSSGVNFKLCQLHFRVEDLVNTSRGLSLKKGAIPIPVAVPKKKISEDPFTDDVKVMDVEEIKSASDHQINFCVSCFQYDIKLQSAYKQIAGLKKRLSELTAKNANILKQMQCISKEKKCSNTCKLCKAKLTTAQLKQHLCIDQESIVCSLCPHSQTFKSVISFLRHLDQHTEIFQAIDKSALYKCNICRNVAYPLEVLLECHKKSHGDIIEQPEKMDLSIESDDLIDEPTSNDYSIFPDDLITVGIDIDESSSNNVSEASGSGPSIQSSSLAEINHKPGKQSIKLFKCGICAMVFDLSKELTSHLHEKHPTARARYALLKCYVCRKDFTASDQLCTHLLSHAKNVAKHKEYGVDQTALSLDLYDEEKTNCSTKKTQQVLLECYVCRKNFTNPVQLRMHLQYHAKNIAKDQKCEVCQTALTLDELNSHLCGEETAIRCDYCSDEFTSTLKFLEHLEKSHEKKKLHGCEKCSKFFPMILKEYHMKTHAHDKPKPFECKICPKTFASEYHLQCHTKRHENTKSHLCEECGKTFASERNLELHKTSLIHHSEPTIQCPDCPRKFLNKANLQRHRELHRDDNYVCQICAAELKSTDSYKKHMKKHQRTEADRRFQCALCPLKFFTPKDVRTHQRAHSSARVFNCRFCDASYKYNGDLNKHLKTHLGDKIHECAKCSKRFKYPMELQKHEFEHYKEEKEAKTRGEQDMNVA